MERFILDTNLFFNMDANLGFGKKTQAIVEGLTLKIKEVKKKGFEFFMPPSIVAEFLSFFEDREQPFIKDFMSQVTVKSPDIAHVNFPSNVFYQVIKEIRERSYKGLNIAEDELKKAVQALMGKTLDKKEFEVQSGEFLKNLRNRYRQATRAGFLDSVADLDLIVLAKEKDAYVVTTDEGVLAWGRIFGVKEMEASVFGAKLRSS